MLLNVSFPWLGAALEMDGCCCPLLVVGGCLLLLVVVCCLFVGGVCCCLVGCLSCWSGFDWLVVLLLLLLVVVAGLSLFASCSCFLMVQANV